MLLRIPASIGPKADWRSPVIIVHDTLGRSLVLAAPVASLRAIAIERVDIVGELAVISESARSATANRTTESLLWVSLVIALAASFGAGALT